MPVLALSCSNAGLRRDTVVKSESRQSKMEQPFVVCVVCFGWGAGGVDGKFGVRRRIVSGFDQ